MANHYRSTEQMVIRCAKEIIDGEVVFAGVGLPLLVVCFAMRTHARRITLLTEGGSVRGTAPAGLAITVDDPVLFASGDATFGMTGAMAALQRGEVDLTFISGAQIDRFGNINSTGVGNWEKPKTFTYFAGSGGANDMATSGKRGLVIIPQDPKKFVERVDYLTSPGFMGGAGHRESMGMLGGGPAVVVSTMGVYRFDAGSREMYLAEYFSGQSVEKVRSFCSFDLSVSRHVKETESPTEEELTLLRELDPKGFYLS